MNEFISNVRAVAISYADTSGEANYTLLQRRAYDTFFDFLSKGAVYKKDSIKYFLCRYWLYSNSELKELYQKRYGKNITNNTLNVTRHNLCKSLEKLLGDDFFETFCEQDDERVADKMAKELIRHIKTLELHDEKYATLFIDEVLNADIEIDGQSYEVEDLKEELDVLRIYTKIMADGKISRVNKSKLAFIKEVLNEETFLEGEINTKKLDLLHALMWG